MTTAAPETAVFSPSHHGCSSTHGRSSKLQAWSRLQIPSGRRGYSWGSRRHQARAPAPSVQPQRGWMKASFTLLSTARWGRRAASSSTRSRPAVRGRRQDAFLHALMSSVAAIVTIQNRGHKIDNVCPMDQMLSLPGRL